MPFYVNDKCPVCERQFTESDDIVTCPECGTPHHRECYKSIGHCANADKHGTDYSFEQTEGSSAEQGAYSNIYYNPDLPKESNKTKCVNCGEEIDSSAVFCSKCSARQPAPDFSSYYDPVPDFSVIGKAPQSPQFSESEKLDGVSLSEIAAVVKTNTLRFITKFKSGKKVSWNWAAFFFGPYYLFFRKMYKEGALFLALRLIITLISQGVYSKEYADFMSFATANMDKLRNPTEELINEIMPLYQAVIPLMAIMTGAMLILHIIIALFADNIYKDKAISTVKKVNEKLDQGGEFGQSMIFMLDNQPSLSQSEMKSIYLGRIGGISIFSPFAAYFAYDLIISLISKL